MLEKVDLKKKLVKEDYKKVIDELRMHVGALQRQAKDLNIPVSIVFEGWKAAGKGTLINELIQSLDPRGVQVFAIHEPNDEESVRPYFWRFWTKIPSKGRMAIFDRSWYQRVLVEKVEKQATEKELHHAYHEIPSFERQLVDEGMIVIKFFLHISRKEQKERLEKLSASEATAWRVTEEDWTHHRDYDAYRCAVEEMMEKTDSDFAPWLIVEATDKRFATVKILTAVAQALEARITKVSSKKESTLLPSIASAVSLVDLKSLKSSLLSEVDLSVTVSADEYQEKLKMYQKRIREIEYIIYKKKMPVLVVLEGWDAAGKGGAIRRLAQNMDPRGYTVIPISAPNDEELNHHYLWRFWRAMPKQGHIAIFDRSWYGRVLVERVEGYCTEGEWRRAYREMNEMEEQWIHYGGTIVKLWLHIDQDEQQRRFTERLSNPDKQWKITGEDWRNREKWAQYEEAIDEMFFRTSTTYAPWTIVEANCKSYARLKVLKTIIKDVEKFLQ
ncbi:polyphosphate:AMP phosphotransferase [Sporomusaceae bacterium BoRhaA]|uniref:phosphate--AMP phosphotransferase n=1 Tax=Pelorhabdus rhamnosifermentans TaxID=2772457 RepID=UPI001C064169|nr:phosphate--AMP phosphotransferase [Pelorhabdus rhamnosifermentans]MBU2703289.1 polyphosphate:AMP phosphotransferase [Pelorhabdus rhamnosifermentans]